MPARVIIVGVLTLALLEGLFGRGLFALVIWTGAMWLAFILIGVLNAILSRLLGFTLEPAGHEGLGESDEPDEPTTP